MISPPARRIAAVFEALEAEALQAMEAEGLPAADVSLRRFADARYAGQSFELRVPADDWATAFHRAHAARYGFDRPAAAVELVTARVEAIGPEPDLGPGTPRGRSGGAVPGARRDDVVYRGEVVAARVIPREALQPGEALAGPAVVHEYSATLWLPPGWRAEALGGGSLSVRRASR